MCKVSLLDSLKKHTHIERAYREYLFQALFFMDFKVWLYRVESFEVVNIYIQL